ncbi:MAG: branched-chain amino acid transport system ATP-binding protein [Thermomicrobiales bacterium]|jgi:branched-chain amino acid transport system ATP-binding protein|nr:branched-chain amino acid transport system ATP-binding protein [Thermomicrobiales bacterium]
MASAVAITSAHRLVARGVTKDFAGLRAVDGVSLELARGEIMGLIGPNGSGKTTTINLLTGLLQITAGTVSVGDTDVTGWPPHRIARAGLARTFQVVKLFKDFTVRENVEVGAISAKRIPRREATRRANEALTRVGIAHLAEVPASVLPQGEERRVEIARALATDPAFLLLDEPGAGLNDAEVEVLLPTLDRVRRDVGCGILIVDHDMRLIMGLCDRIHVLNYGRTIAEGTPEEVRREPAVIEAYLGSEVETSDADRD